MRVYYPAYYKEFRCIAAACPDSCCKEWTVDVDDASAAYYRSLEGELGDRLRQVLKDTEEGTVMQIEAGRCPMWRRDGLCRIQAELGHDALCKTCREFPRLRHDYGDFVELGLEMSCPEAARLILENGDCSFCTELHRGGEAPEYETALIEALLESREKVLDLLKNRAYSVPERLAVMLLYGHAVQAQLDGGEGMEMDPRSCLAEAKKYAQKGDIRSLLAFFKSLEILSKDWERRLEGGGEAIIWDEKLSAVAQYMTGRYWLQAVADYDLISRVKLTVAACVLIAALDGCIIEKAQQFSKEIENDPDNVEKILDGAYTDPALTDVNLLSLLLG